MRSCEAFALTGRTALPYFHGAFMRKTDSEKVPLVRAVITDIQFWIPVTVLLFGLLLLVSLH